MRLFIAVTFPNDLLERITEVQSGLRAHALHGNFTRRENLHLTLHFLGEVQNSGITAIRRAMDNANHPPFPLVLGGLGVFRRGGGDLWWLGIQSNDALAALHQTLGQELRAAGFSLEDRRYTPHLTLGREVSLRGGFDPAPLENRFGQRQCEVRSIVLMKSERLRGVLTYTPCYEKALYV